MTSFDDGADLEFTMAIEVLPEVPDRLNEMYCKHTGQELSVIEANLERDTFIGATQSKEFGLIDEVVVERAAARPKTRAGPVLPGPRISGQASRRVRTSRSR